jgi:ketosteroid isomerase-like protein
MRLGAVVGIVAVALMSAATTRGADDEAAVLAADDARIKALTGGDFAALAERLADDLRYVHSTGSVDTKASFLELVRSEKSRYTRYEPRERVVRFPAPGIALDSGRARLVVETADGPVDAEFHYLAGWRHDAGGWKLFAWQSARAPKPPVAPAFAVTFDEPPVPGADGGAAIGTGWRDLGPDDFENVNGAPDTWTWKDGGLHCTGKPVGVIRTKRSLQNLELSLDWRHLTDGGNSGVFLWAPPEAFFGIEPGQLPRGGIEVQILDHGFRAKYESSGNRKGDWFSTDGGTRCVPASGHLCLESEGAPVEFRRLRIRELP